MVYRDPDTGEFVSGAPDTELGGYEQLERSEAKTLHRVDAADNGGADMEENQYVANDISMAIIPDLGRGEVAELVTLRTNTSLSLPVTATAEGYAVGTFALSSSAEQPAVCVQGLGSNAPTGSDLDTDDAIDFDRQGSPGASDVLYSTTVVGENSVADSTNGLGAGADTARYSEAINFHDELGGGPVFDNDHALYLHATLDMANVSDHRVEGYNHFQAIWDVHEVEDQ